LAPRVRCPAEHAPGMIPVSDLAGRDTAKPSGIAQLAAWPTYCTCGRMVWAAPLRCAFLVAVAALVQSCRWDLGTCATDRDCRAGHVCNHRATCELVQCRSDSDCRTGSICTTQFACKVGCRFNRDCPAGERCVAGDYWADLKQCVSGCRSHLECGPSEVCSYGECTPGCLSTQDCQPGTFCSGFPARCVPGCHDDGECGSSGLCSEGTCLLACASSEECPPGESCAAVDAFGSIRREPSSCPRWERCDLPPPLPCVPGERCACDGSPPDGGTDAGRGDDAGPSRDAETRDAAPPDASFPGAEGGAR
jgi:hypothetical protein